MRFRNKKESRFWKEAYDSFVYGRGADDRCAYSVLCHKAALFADLSIELLRQRAGSE